MDEGTIAAKRLALDNDLTRVGRDVGVAFGPGLFRAFQERGWITLETFGAVGSDLFNAKVPAYGQTHFAFSTWGLADQDFEVGRDA